MCHCGCDTTPAPERPRATDTRAALGPDCIGEITAREGHRLTAADDLDRAFELVKLACGTESRQPSHMIQVEVGQQHMTQSAESELGAHQLALGPLAAIDQEPSRPARDQQCWRTPFGGGHRRSSAEKDELEHVASRKFVSGRKSQGDT